MIARFFIGRPIFAAVLSLAVTLAGGLAVGTLPISQYPQVTPPTIQIDCNYPGANAKVVADTIAAPVEQQVNGVEDMLYMNSQSTSDGSYTCTVTFAVGTDLNMAQVRVQNRVNLAVPLLPDVVRATGVTTRKRSPEILMTVALRSPADGPPDARRSQLYLSNFAVLRIKDELSRLPGISDVTVFGQRDYAMRVWLDTDKLAARGLTAADVVAALREQNGAVAAGQVGQPPADAGQVRQMPITVVGRLSSPEEFGAAVVKVGPRGQVVRVRDVARVVTGSRVEDVANFFDREPTIGLAIFLLSDANALETRDLVAAKMKELGPAFPPGVDYVIGYDTTPFIRESIGEVENSLYAAVALVALVVLVFLQSWRAALIPLAAVPVAIVGTFAAMAAVGFTLNNLTLFGLVLAVGIVVDDAIVVVEATQHYIEKGFAPREATARAMDDVSGPVVAVGVVLAAVFVPCAFLSGVVGQFFKQFALTIAVSTVISTVNSLTLSPALCALLLKGKRTKPRGKFWGRVAAVLGFPASLFNASFDRIGRAYVRLVGFGLRVPVLVLAGYAGLLVVGFELYATLPTGFIPQQDKGYLIASVQLPDAASADRTRAAMDHIARLALDTPGVRHVNAVAGNSFVLSAYGSNFGSMFIILDPFAVRRNPGPNGEPLGAEAVMTRLRARFAKEVPEANVLVFGAPAVSGLGRAGGFRVMVEDRLSRLGPDGLQAVADNFIDNANRQPEVVAMSTVYKTNSPQVYLDVDRAAGLARGVDVGDVNATLRATMGSQYVNDFNLLGRTWQVDVQAESKARDEPEDVKRLKVRSNTGKMVPLGALSSARLTNAPLVVTRYNMYPAAAVNGNVAARTSTGDAVNKLERLARELGVDTEWTELTFIEQQAKRKTIDLPGGYRFEGDMTGFVFGISVVFVFLVLAALYESWAFPLAVILVVPVCVASSLAAVWLTDPGSAAATVAEWVANPSVPGWLKPGAWAAGAGGWVDRVPVGTAAGWVSKAGVGKQDVNIFTQIGFVVLVGLACKNAILIVEFAKVSRDAGADLRTAILGACKLRFRPILMTSVAFMLGVVPLAIAKGAGGEMRQALGVAVLGGMAGVTVFGIFLTPVFFAVVDRVSEGPVFRNRWVRGVSDSLLWVLRFRFVRPLAGQVAKVTRRVTTRRPGA